MRRAGEDIAAEGSAPGRGHRGFSTFDFWFSNCGFSGGARRTGQTAFRLLAAGRRPLPSQVVRPLRALRFAFRVFPPPLSGAGRIGRGTGRGMRGVGEDEVAEGLALGRGHRGFLIFDFGFWILLRHRAVCGGPSSGHWPLTTGHFRPAFIARFEFGVLRFEFWIRRPGPVELDAEEAAGAGGGGGLAVDAADFSQEGGEGREAVGDGVGFGEGGKRGEFIDGGDMHFAQARRVGNLAGAEQGAGPKADGLAFFARADEFDQMAFEQKHSEKIKEKGKKIKAGV